MTPEEKLPSLEETEAALLQEPDELEVFDNPEEKAIAIKLVNGPWYKKILERAEEKATARHSKLLDEQVTKLVEDNKTMIQATLDEIRKANEPLKPEELTKLINQEYLEFTFTMQRNGVRAAREFTIRELPVKMENRIIKTLRKTLSSSLKELSSLEWTTEQSNLQRIQQIVDMVPGALETLAECVSICLNPYGDEKDVDLEWVLDNMTAQKILVVLQLQAEANRWRDFISLVSRTIPSQMRG